MNDSEVFESMMADCLGNFEDAKLVLAYWVKRRDIIINTYSQIYVLSEDEEFPNYDLEYTQCFQHVRVAVRVCETFNLPFDRPEPM